LKIAWRNIWKNKLFSAINIISLSIGISASLIIGMMVYFESTFDTFHKDGELIYRITSDFHNKDGDGYNSGVPVPLIRVAEKGMSHISLFSAFFQAEPSKVENKKGAISFKNPEFVVYADNHYFQLFNYQWLAGTPDIALNEPNEVILTFSRAEKYFPNLTPSQVLGRTLIYNDSTLTKVTGVVADMTQRTDFIFKEFISIKTGFQSELKRDLTSDNWNSTNSSTQLFIKLADKTSEAGVQKQLLSLAKEHESADAKKYGSTRNFHLQPLNDIHFNNNYGNFDFNNSQASKKVLISLVFVAAFLLLLGCINFINLNTAQATQRAKEIGVRKTLGSSKKQLVSQFMGETFLLTFFSALASLILVFLLLKAFSDFLPVGLTFSFLLNPAIIIYLILLILMVSLLSGLYPAFVLTRFKPVAVLKGQMLSGPNKSLVRQSLTVFQFVIAQVFIMSTLLVGKQIHYLLTKDLGFRTDAVAYIRTPWTDQNFNKRELLLQKIRAIPQITEASLGGNAPASTNTHSTGIDYKDGMKEIHAELQLLYGDTNYLKIYHLKLLAGRNLISDTTKEFVINEALMRTLGFKTPQEAIGKMPLDGNSNQNNPIVGVVADFNQRSLRTGIEPMALIGDWSRQLFSQFQFVHISLQKDHPENWSKAIEKVNAAWKEVYPEDNFEYTFVDDAVKRFYQSETKTASLLNWMTGLSIIISCLGLLGLVIYTTEKRTKEIGVRKVLGASVLQLAKLLCFDFLFLVGLAFMIALPIAWWGVNYWMADFAYKTTLSWWLFLGSGLGMMLIALLTMSFKTLKTANINPVKSLRTE
ncbi:MAG: ABC transporter permease, partial [Bacteroidetes bacterium]|nr:ABC transporter permease [Bacteroidota bacterium]